METVEVRPMQWASTPDIDEVSRFCETDIECFRELRDVLKRFDALDRFGITLIHNHFDLSEDEALVEFTDVENRKLVTVPLKLSEINQQQVTVTNWQLGDSGDLIKRQCYCQRTSDSHTRGHVAY